MSRLLMACGPDNHGDCCGSVVTGSGDVVECSCFCHRERERFLAHQTNWTFLIAVLAGGIAMIYAVLFTVQWVGL